ncbi:MAG: hypothetical protein E7586_06280 [Ruminococcaceae bacterium]|nr:hypothetical protein [Oscillospiraceae bacterium]
MFLVFPRYKLRVSIFAIPAMILLYWCEGALPFMILLCSALVHEIGHLTAIKCLGYKIRRIDILPMGALIVVPEGIPDDKEWKIALSGPLASLILALISGLIFVFIPILPLFFAFVMNLIIAFFNLLPIKHLDGGKALFCLFRSRNTKGIFLSVNWEEAQKKTVRLCTVFSNLSVLFFLLVATMFVAITGFNFGGILLLLTLALQLMPELNRFVE